MMDKLKLAEQLEAIRNNVDAFNPDARMAARSAFDAAEQVWKMVPDIIAALRTQSRSNENVGH
jgi:accessory colonization factor AcfC